MSTTSNSRPRWKAALVVAALLGTTAVLPLQVVQAADQKAPPKQSVSSGIVKPLQAAQTALAAKNYPDAITALKEADAFAKKTPYDQHIIDELSGQAAAGSQDWPEAGKRFEASSKDGFLTPEDSQKRLQFATECYYNAAISKKDDKAVAGEYFAKAIETGNKALAGGAGSEIAGIVASASYVQGDFKTVRQVEEQQIAATVAKGGTPDEQALDLWRSACFKMGDNDCLFNAFKSTLAYHPKPEYWEQALSVIAQSASKNQADELQLYRLMLETGTLKRSAEYSGMASISLQQGSPGEAQAVLEKGFSSNVFTDQVKAENQKLLTSAKVKAKTDQASLESLTKEVEAAPTGQKLYALGYAYFGYGQYDKAVDLLGKALDKGGLRNEADARLLLGIAQLKGGHREDALKTFEQVKGDPSQQQIAALWPLTTKTGT